MSTNDANPPTNTARPRAWIAAWAIVLAAIFAYGWYHARQVEQYHLATTRWHYALAKHHERSAAEVVRIRELLAMPFGKPGSQREAERLINGGKPFDLHKEGDLDVTNWHDPEHLTHISLGFRDGVLVSSSISGEDGSYSKRNPAPIPLWTKPSESWRHWIVRFGAWTWGIAGATWLALPRRRLLAAQVMLAAALATSAALAVNPLYSITWSGIFSNDHLFFAVVMLSISIIALAITLRRVHTGETALRVQFGLRHALMAITVIAILFAAGPFGYLTAAVGALGIALFAVVYLVTRSHVAQQNDRWHSTAVSNKKLT